MRSRWHSLVLTLAVAGLLALTGPVPAEEAKVKEGQKAPDIELPATQVGTVLPEKKDAKTLRLSDLKGKNVVLYFFPKALTGG